jgi:hypothetical protein
MSTATRRARRTVSPMTGGSGADPAADAAHPTLAQEAGAAISGAVLRLAYMTGAQIVHAQPWPGASFTEEQPEPGAGIRIALALERAARAGVRVFIARAREAGMSWEQVGEALGVAELARQRGSTLAEAAFEYAAQRPAYLTGQLGAVRWTCQACGELISDRGPLGDHPAEVEQGHAEGCQRLAVAVAEWLAQGD